MGTEPKGQMELHSLENPMHDPGCTCSKQDPDTLTVPQMIGMLRRIHDNTRWDPALKDVAPQVEQVWAELCWLRELASQVAAEHASNPMPDVVPVPEAGPPLHSGRAPTLRASRNRQ